MNNKCRNGFTRKGSHYLIKAFTELNLKNAELIFVGSIEYDFKKLLENLPI